jgi:hypothetical protein
VRAGVNGAGKDELAKARGGYDRNRKRERCRFIVEVVIPGAGLGGKLDAINAWAKQRVGNDGYMTTSRVDRSDPMRRVEILQIRFDGEDAAQAFAAAFDLPYVGPSREPSST